MPTQVGQTRGVSDVPVFYIPAGNEPFSIAAATWHSFLAEKNKHAIAWHMARMRALDPSARAKALLDAYGAQTDRLNALNSRMAESQKTKRTLLPELIRAMVAFRDQDLRASLKTAEIESAEQIAGVAPPRSDPERQLQDDMIKTLRRIENAKTPAESAQAFRDLQAQSAMVGDLVPSEGAPKRAFNRPLNEMVDRMRVTMDLSDREASELRSTMGVDILPPEGPRTKPGARSVGSVMSELSKATGMDIPAMLAEDKEVATSRTVAGPAAQLPPPQPQEPPPETEDEFIRGLLGPGRPAAAPPPPPTAAAPPPPGMGADVYQDVGRAFEGSPYGKFGEPIPGYSRGAKMRQVSKKLSALSPEERADLIESTTMAGEAGAPDLRRAKSALSETRTERASREAELRPDIQAGLPGAETVASEVSESTKKGQRQIGKATEAEVRAYESGVPLEDFITPRKRKKVGEMQELMEKPWFTAEGELELSPSEQRKLGAEEEDLSWALKKRKKKGSVGAEGG